MPGYTLDEVKKVVDESRALEDTALAAARVEAAKEPGAPPPESTDELLDPTAVLVPSDVPSDEPIDGEPLGDWGSDASPDSGAEASADGGAQPTGAPAGSGEAAQASASEERSEDASALPVVQSWPRWRDSAGAQREGDGSWEFEKARRLQ